MERIINLLKQNRFKVFILIIIIGAIVLASVILLRGNKNNSLNAEIQQSCEAVCVYNPAKSTWDFSTENIKRSFPSKDACLRFCFMMSKTHPNLNP